MENHPQPLNRTISSIVTQWLQVKQKVVSRVRKQFQTRNAISRNPGYDHQTAMEPAQDLNFALSARFHRQIMPTE
ncbi:hypothetical protein TNCV_2236011 [Trichonephila clavipes]|nr:hypothetical protein TNCV_2236011 [Trichonephila clavipes]